MRTRQSRARIPKDDVKACTWFLVAAALEKRDDWSATRPDAAAEVRRELPKRIEKARQKLRPQELIACDGGAAAWTAAHPDRRPR